MPIWQPQTAGTRLPPIPSGVVAARIQRAGGRSHLNLGASLQAFLVIGVLLSAAAVGQSLERVIYLPDSLGGSGLCKCILHSPVNGAVYVAGVSGPDRGTINVIDVATGEKLARIPLRSAPTALCLNADESKLYCALGGEKPGYDSAIAVVDCATNRLVRVVVVGAYPRALCLSRSTGRIYCANYGFSGRRDSSLSVIDTDLDSVVATVNLSGCATDVCWDSLRNKVYVCAVAGNCIAVLDGTADTIVALIDLPGSPWEVRYVASFNKVYCTMPAHRTVAVIDCSTDSLVASVLAPLINPEVFCSNDDLGLGYIIGSKDKVGVLDLNGDTLLRSIEIGDRDERLPRVGLVNTDEDKLYVAQIRLNDVHHEVVVVDCTSDSIITRVDVGIGGWAMALDQEHNRLYCASREMSVAVIDCASDSLADVVYVGFGASFLSFAGTADKVYALQGGSLGAVCVFDGSSGRPLGVVRTARRGRAMCVNTVDGKLYVANGLSRSVSVVDIFGDSLLLNIPVAPDPAFLDYHPGLNRVYCGNSHTSITTICGQGDTIIRVTEVPGAMEELVCVPELDRLYGWMVLGGEKGMFAYDCVRDSVIAPLNRCPGFQAMRGIGYCREYMKIYAADAARNIYVIDATADTFLYERDLGGRFPPNTQLCYVQSTDELYVPDEETGVMEVFDCRTESVVGRIGTDPPGEGIHYDPGANKVYFGLASGGTGVVDVSTRTVSARFPGSGGKRFASDVSRRRVYSGQAELSCLAVFRDSAGSISESQGQPRASRAAGSVLKGASLQIAACSSADLMDIAGRKVMSLQPGENDVRHVRPGVYFVVSADCWKVRKVQICR